MDEVERRVVAHELALIEVVAHVERAHLLTALQSIRAGCVIGITEEERVIRIAAIDMLEDAVRRHEPAAMGMFLQSRGFAMTSSATILAFVLTAWHEIPQGRVGRALGTFANRPACERALGHALGRPGEHLACWPVHLPRTTHDNVA